MHFYAKGKAICYMGLIARDVGQMLQILLVQMQNDVFFSDKSGITVIRAFTSTELINLTAAGVTVITFAVKGWGLNL